jgi:hypothetical protein
MAQGRLVRTSWWSVGGVAWCFCSFLCCKKWALGLFVCDLVLYIVFVSTVGAIFICQLAHSFQTHVTMHISLQHHEV